MRRDFLKLLNSRANSYSFSPSAFMQPGFNLEQLYCCVKELLQGHKAMQFRDARTETPYPGKGQSVLFHREFYKTMPKNTANICRLTRKEKKKEKRKERKGKPRVNLSKRLNSWRIYETRSQLRVTQTKSIHANCLQRFRGGALIPRNCLR